MGSSRRLSIVPSQQPRKPIGIVTRAGNVRGEGEPCESGPGQTGGLSTIITRDAMTPNALPQAADREALAGFFFWSAWSATADRPGETGLSYTSNWPHEPIVGNELPGSAAIWSIASIILLLAGIAGMVLYYQSHAEEPDPAVPQKDPLVNAVANISRSAVLV